MLKKMLKKIFVVVSIAGFLILSCDDMAFSQSKKKTSKTSSKKRASSTKTSKKRAGTSNSSSRPSTKRANTTTTTTTKKVTLSESATAVKTDEDACRDAFVYCMDAQIKDIIDKYTYLYDDEAVQSYLETSEPFRCLYYDTNNKLLPQNMQVVSSCRDVLNTATVASFDSSQADMDKLISQYSDYLKKATCSTTGEAVLEYNTTPKTGICSSCTYKTLNAFLTSHSFVDTTWKNYQSLCKEQYLVDKYKNETDITKAADEYKNFVYENCISRNVNDLYFSYNYYCDLRTSTLKNAVGVKTNYCKLSSEDTDNKGLEGDALVRAEMANVFGTTSSAEYYKEALRRLETGELKMTNFTDSNLYKQKIEGLGLETLKTYDISSLLNTVTKCDDGYRYNSAIGACQLYNTAEAKYEDAGLVAAEFIAPASTKNATCESGDLYDDVSKKCIRCQTNYKWNTIVRKCQNTDEKYSNIVRAAQEEDVKDARSIYTDLGIERDNSLFSINVVPPLGSGLVFPAALFNKASEYCFDGKEKTLNGLSTSQKQTYVAFNKRKVLLKQCKEEYRDDLERYYLSGYWPKDDVEPDSNGKYNLDTDYKESDFMSAKKSCDMYEQNLISVRNNHYAKFDTQLKNYLEDALAVIIKNKIKDIQTIANVATALQKNDSELTLNNIKAKADRELARMDAETKALELEEERLSEQREADKQYMKEQGELKKLIVQNNSTAIISACGTLGKDIVSEWAKGGDKSASSLMMKLSNLLVKVNGDGDVKPYPVNGDLTAYNNLDSGAYSEISCLDVNGFYTSASYASIGSSIQNELSSKEELTVSGGSGSLSPGIYLIEVAGAGGGGAGGYGWNEAWVGWDCRWRGGGNGGNGDLQTKVVAIFDGDTNYTYVAGEHGSEGAHEGDTATDGGSSSFSISSMGISFAAAGGKAGTPANRNNSGVDAPNSGNGLGGKGGGGGTGHISAGNCDGHGGSDGAAGWVKIYRFK